jgi:hypothetical protein
VFDLAVEGRSTQGIADELVVTEATVRSHLTRIYAKLEVQGRIDLLGQLASQDVPRAEGDPVAVAQAGGVPVWPTAGLAAGALLVAILLPLSSIILAPALLALGLVLRRRAAGVRPWSWMVVIGSGALITVEALLVVAVLVGLATAGS